MQIIGFFHRNFTWSVRKLSWNFIFALEIKLEYKWFHYTGEKFNWKDPESCLCRFLDFFKDVFMDFCVCVLISLHMRNFTWYFIEIEICFQKSWWEVLWKKKVQICLLLNTNFSWKKFILLDSWFNVMWSFLSSIQYQSMYFFTKSNSLGFTCSY